jgi:class 3 adenylate cyclase
VLAYFGYPVAREHDARAAIRAGLSILRQLAEDRGRQRIAARVGIHTGLVVAGEMGSGDQRSQLPIGTTVNIAARLQEIAQPGEVVISDATLRLTRGFFVYRDLGTPPIKGITTPIQVFAVASESGAGNTIEATLGAGLTQLIGRDAERRVLFDRWQQACHGAGQVVFVSGEAGIGKSRLLHELK